MHLAALLVLYALATPAPRRPLPACAAAATISAPDSAPSPAALWKDGVTFGEFTGRMQNRKDDWAKRNEWGAVPDLLVARMRAITAPLRILMVAEEECSDSMNSMPYLVRLAQFAPAIEVRVINSTVGRSIMEAHRTPDGRAATPTVVVLDQRDSVVACWVERPSTLRGWLKAPKDSLPKEQRFGGRREWYENDKGASAIAEWVPLLENAAAGRMSCSN